MRTDLFGSCAFVFSLQHLKSDKKIVGTGDICGNDGRRRIGFLILLIASFT
jgi:hypothetical protein